MLEDLRNRYATAEQQIAKIKKWHLRNDMTKMLKTVKDSIEITDMATVECRRLRKITPKFAELQQKTEELMENLEQHLTLALLMG